MQTLLNDTKNLSGFVDYPLDPFYFFLITSSHPEGSVSPLPIFLPELGSSGDQDGLLVLH
jgi:hypothetical protein